MSNSANQYRLFDGKYEPYTYHLGYIKTNYQNAAKYYKTWSDRFIKPYRDLRAVHLDVSKGDIFESLLPLTQVASKIIFAQCLNGWTMVSTNAITTLDYTTIMHNMANIYGLDCVVLDYVRNIYPPKNYKEGDDHYESYGKIVFNYYDGEKYKSNNFLGRRAINLSRQGAQKWSFHSSGETLDFEDLNVFKKRKIVDRFSPELLVKYARHVGIDPYNPEFYTGPVILYTVEASWLHDEPQMLEPKTFREARAEFGYDKLYDTYGDDEDSSKPHLDDVQKNESKKSDEFEPLDEYQADSLRLSELQALLPLPVEQVSVGDLNFSFTGNKDNSSFKLYVDCDWRIAPALEKNRLEEFPKNQQEPIKALQGGMIIAVEADTPDAYDPLITVRDIHGEEWVIHILSEDENAPWGVIQNREQIIEGPSWQAHEAWKEARRQETER